MRSCVDGMQSKMSTAFSPSTLTPTGSLEGMGGDASAHTPWTSPASPRHHLVSGPKRQGSGLRVRSLPVNRSQTQFTQSCSQPSQALSCCWLKSPAPRYSSLGQRRLPCLHYLKLSYPWGSLDHHDLLSPRRCYNSLPFSSHHYSLSGSPHPFCSAVFLHLSSLIPLLTKLWWGTHWLP